LPEDRLLSLYLREDELGAGKTGPIEHEIDRRSPPGTEQDGRPLDDLSLGRPRLPEAVAVDAGGRRPRLARLQDEPVLEWEPEQVGQLAVCVGSRRPGRRECDRSCGGSVVLVNQSADHVAAKDVRGRRATRAGRAGRSGEL
jgi:hypothetical protein